MYHVKNGMYMYYYNHSHSVTKSWLTPNVHCKQEMFFLCIRLLICRLIPGMLI